VAGPKRRPGLCLVARLSARQRHSARPAAPRRERQMTIASFWPFRRRYDSKKVQSQHPVELRVATSGSFSIRATVEVLARVDGASTSCSQTGRVRAALFVPSTITTVQFHGDNIKKPSANARSSCVHVLQMFTPAETAQVLQDAQRIGTAIGWSDRGVSLPTQDVLVQNLSKESQDLVHRAIREQLLPFARRQYPHLNSAFDKQPYPRPGNLFIVRYSAASGRPGGRGLKLHKDETALTFNMCLSPQGGFEGGGTYFPACSGDVDGILLRPTPGYCLVHDGNIKHAGNDVVSGDRFILVGFYNADGRDRAGEELYFSKRALEESRTKFIGTPPPPIQTIYFTTAVATARGSLGSVPTSSTQKTPPPSTLRPMCATSSLPSTSSAIVGGSGAGSSSSSSSDSMMVASSSLRGQSERRNLSSVAIQGPVAGEDAFESVQLVDTQREYGSQQRGRPSEKLPREEQAGGEDSDRSRERARERAREQAEEDKDRSASGVERLKGVTRTKMEGRMGGKMDGWLEGWVSGCSPRGGSSAVGPSPSGGSYGPLSVGFPCGGGESSNSASLDGLASNSMLSAGLVERIDIPASAAPSPNLSPTSQQASSGPWAQSIVLLAILLAILLIVLFAIYFANLLTTLHTLSCPSVSLTVSFSDPIPGMCLCRWFGAPLLFPRYRRHQQWVQQ